MFPFCIAQEIKDGTINVDLKIGDTPVADTFPLCIALDLINIGLKCPIKAGPGKIQATATIPETSPVSRHHNKNYA